MDHCTVAVEQCVVCTCKWHGAILGGSTCNTKHGDTSLDCLSEFMSRYCTGNTVAVLSALRYRPELQTLSVTCTPIEIAVIPVPQMSVEILL
jgi:hypothetical protein